MPRLHPACPLDALVPGQPKTVDVGDLQLALVRLGDQVYALDNACPHRGGPLGEGQVEGHELYCPMHCWPFDVRTGECTLYENSRVQTFETRVEGGTVYVALP